MASMVNASRTPIGWRVPHRSVFLLAFSLSEGLFIAEPSGGATRRLLHCRAGLTHCLLAGMAPPQHRAFSPCMRLASLVAAPIFPRIAPHHVLAFLAHRQEASWNVRKCLDGSHQVPAPRARGCPRLAVEVNPRQGPLYPRPEFRMDRESSVYRCQHEANGVTVGSVDPSHLGGERLPGRLGARGSRVESGLPLGDGVASAEELAEYPARVGV